MFAYACHKEAIFGPSVAYRSSIASCCCTADEIHKVGTFCETTCIGTCACGRSYDFVTKFGRWVAISKDINFFTGMSKKFITILESDGVFAILNGCIADSASDKFEIFLCIGSCLLFSSKNYKNSVYFVFGFLAYFIAGIFQPRTRCCRHLKRDC